MSTTAIVLVVVGLLLFAIAQTASRVIQQPRLASTLTVAGASVIGIACIIAAITIWIRQGS